MRCFQNDPPCQVSQAPDSVAEEQGSSKGAKFEETGTNANGNAGAGAGNGAQPFSYAYMPEMQGAWPAGVQIVSATPVCWNGQGGIDLPAADDNGLDENGEKAKRRSTRVRGRRPKKNKNKGLVEGSVDGQELNVSEGGYGGRPWQPEVAHQQAPAPQQPQQAQQQVQPHRGQRQMVAETPDNFCKWCKCKMQADHAFCSGCGASKPDEAENSQAAQRMNFCPWCRCRLEVDYKFCTDCGASLSSLGNMC